MYTHKYIRMYVIRYIPFSRKRANQRMIAKEHNLNTLTQNKITKLIQTHSY